MTQAAFDINSGYLISTLDLVKPLWASKLYQPYDMIDIKEMTLMMAGAPKETVGNITGVHYELDRPTTYFQAGDLFTVAGAQNIQTGPLAAALVNPDGTSAATVGRILKDYVTMQTFQIDSVSNANPPVVTLRPLNTGFNTAIPSGRVLSYITRTEKERSSAPAQLVRGTTAYNWYTQITRQTINLSGTAKNLQLKPAVLADGGSLNGWNTVQTKDSEAQMLRDMFGAYMFGDPTASAQANLNISLSTSAGLDRTIQNRGWNLNIGSAAITEANILTATSRIKEQAATEFYQIWMPNKRMIEWNDIFLAQQANSLNPVLDKIFTNMFFGNETKTENLRAVYNFAAISINNVNFAVKELNLLNNPTTFNVNSTSSFQNLMYFLPMGKANVTVDGGKTINSDFVTVMNRGQYDDRWMLMRTRGLQSNGANDGVDQYVCDMLTDFGYRFVMMNSFGRIF